MTPKTALILVDLQNDFCRGGSLAVPDGDAVISIANQLQPCFKMIIASQDWHPRDHMSFASNHENSKVGDFKNIENVSQVLWPDHCIQYHHGAEFHPNLHTQSITKIIRKGIVKEIDSYSAFFDNAHLRSTGLADYLQAEQVKILYILGLATDYCVKFTALDAVALGFEVYLIVDACRGVELSPGDIDQALKEMCAAGVKLITSTDITHQSHS